MQIPDFKLERYFAAHEFKVRHLLSASDCEALTLNELLDMADEEALGLWRNLKMSYTESQGHPLLRQEIARQYATVQPDELLVAAPEELIFIAMNALLRPGDQVIATFPGYQSLYQIAEAIGCTVTRWPLEPAPAGWRLDLDFLARSMTPQTKLLVVNFPHNPTGYLPSRSEYAAIIEIARRQGLYLFSDEMYRLLEHDPAGATARGVDAYERGVSLSGMSKSFGLPGLRIGWLALHDRGLLDRCLAFHDYTTICNSAPSELLALMALRAQERIVTRNLAIIRKNLAVFEAFCARHTDLFDPHPPQGGSVAFPHLRDEQPVGAFCRDVLDRKDVMILPGDVFDHTGNYFRVGLGRADFEVALAQVEAYLAER